MARDTGIELSIVTSMFRSAPFLEEFYRRSVDAAAAVTDRFEIVLVNDGSPDESLEVALRLHRRDPRVRVVDLSRNFGHHKALMTGLARARGELVFLIDCDLEEDPAWLIAFLGTLQRTGADVVYGVQRSRKGGAVERAAGHLFFRVVNPLLGNPMQPNVVTARLMSRRYVQALVAHRDREVCLSGLWVITGFDQQPMEIVKGKRPGSSYSFRRRVSVLVNAITSFSNRPLIAVFYIGAGVMLLSVLAAALLIVLALTHGIGVAGYASLMVSIWFLGGLTIFCVGIVGVYVAKIFTETKERPYTIVRAEYGGPESHGHADAVGSDAAVLRG
jgi:putative glycosyltransferase